MPIYIYPVVLRLRCENGRAEERVFMLPAQNHLPGPQALLPLCSLSCQEISIFLQIKDHVYVEFLGALVLLWPKGTNLL